jgi:molybdenum cofactor synthesis domain-containing protein
MRTAILTVSTSVAAGRTEDLSGQALAELATQVGAQITAQDLVADDADAIQDWLRRQVSDGTSVILTTGGTGFTPDDITPEATRAVIEREAPGIAEAMRAESRRHTPMGILSRGVSGLAGRSLIVNFPATRRRFVSCSA